MSCSRSTPKRSPIWRMVSCGWRSGRARGCSSGATVSTGSSRPSCSFRATGSIRMCGSAWAKSWPAPSRAGWRASRRVSAKARSCACTTSSCGRGARDPNPDVGALEAEVVEAVPTGTIGCGRTLRAAAHAANAAKWRTPFRPGIAAGSTPRQSLKDIAELESLGKRSHRRRVSMSRPERAAQVLNLWLYHYGAGSSAHQPAPDPREYGISSHRGNDLSIGHAARRAEAVIHECCLRPNVAGPIELAARERALEATFMAIWTGHAENDAFNALTLRQGLDWREISLSAGDARAICARHAAAYSRRVHGQTLVKHSSIAARLIVALFQAVFDPARHDEARQGPRQGDRGGLQRGLRAR